GVARVQDQGNSHGLPGPAGELTPMRAGRRRQGFALYVAEQDSPALEDVAIFQVARNPATTFLAIPAVGEERFSINVFQCIDDAALEIKQIILNGFDGYGHGR